MPRTPILVKDQFRWPTLLLGLLFILPISVISADLSVRVAWDPNPESNIKGYRIYHGAVNAGYTNVMDVGRNTVGSVTNLSYETQYFFYVTAYNVYDLESDPSLILYYTTAPQIPVSVATKENILAFAPVELRIPAELEGDAEPTIEIKWVQLTGPSQVTIQNDDKVEPTVLLTAVGDYTFKVQVRDESGSDQSVTNVRIVDPVGASDGPQPHLYPLQFLFDGIAVYWDSITGAVYDIGFKSDLNSPFWILLETDIQSHGDAYTYWVDDSPDLLQPGFYTIFGTQ